MTAPTTSNISNATLDDILAKYLQDHSKAQAHDRLQEHHLADTRAKQALTAYIQQECENAKIAECKEIAETIASNKQGIHPDFPLTANAIEEWIGRRLRNYIQNGAQDILLDKLKDLNQGEEE